MNINKNCLHCKVYLLVYLGNFLLKFIFRLIFSKITYFECLMPCQQKSRLKTRFPFSDDLFQWNRLISRMVFINDVFQADVGDVGVDLCGVDVGVSEHELYGAQIDAVVDEVGGEGVA